MCFSRSASWRFFRRSHYLITSFDGNFAITAMLGRQTAAQAAFSGAVRHSPPASLLQLRGVTSGFSGYFARHLGLPRVPSAGECFFSTECSSERGISALLAALHFSMPSDTNAMRINPIRTWPNHALQRTAPRVTVAAISGLCPSRPSVELSYARSLSLRSTTQLPRHAPPSLSLGSLGVATRFL